MPLTVSTAKMRELTWVGCFMQQRIASLRLCCASAAVHSSELSHRLQSQQRPAAAMAHPPHLSPDAEPTPRENEPLMSPVSYPTPEPQSSPDAPWPGTGGLPLYRSPPPPAHSDRTHRDAAASWSVLLSRRWQQIRRADWNLICASALAFFFFLLYITSSEGRCMRRNASCPVPVTSLDYEPPPLHDRHGHQKLHPEANAAPPCTPPPVSAQAAAEMALATAWSSGETAPRVLRSSSTPLQLSSHKESKVRKRVHVPRDTVPNLLQFAEATFEPGDEAGQFGSSLVSFCRWARS